MKNLYLLGGYSKNPPEKDFNKLIKSFKKNNVKIRIIDYLKKVRKESLGSMVTIKNSINATKEANKEIDKTYTDKNRKTVITWSYGIIPLALLEWQNLEKVILICPPFGTKSVIWKQYEKPLLKIPIFKGFRELENEEFWDRIFRNLQKIKEKGTEITFLLPPKTEGINQDERIQYLGKSKKMMENLGEIVILPAHGHRQAIEHKENIEKIKTLL